MFSMSVKMSNMQAKLNSLIQKYALDAHENNEEKEKGE